MWGGGKSGIDSGQPPRVVKEEMGLREKKGRVGGRSGEKKKIRITGHTKKPCKARKFNIIVWKREAFGVWWGMG